MYVLSIRKAHLKQWIFLFCAVVLVSFWLLKSSLFVKKSFRDLAKANMVDIKELAEKMEARLAEKMQSGRNKSLTYENQQFVMGGLPLRILSGAVHYFRVVPEYWKDRMLKLKACGLNTVETYVPWNLHEPEPGVFNFEGMLDIRHFLKLAHSLELLVILRPGPYICSEWDFGGLPSWLLRDPEMKVRSDYAGYTYAVENYFKKLIPLVADFQISKGGPIIAVQVENEFGSYSDQIGHLVFLRKLLLQYGIQEMLMTSDGLEGTLRAKLVNALPTANFNKIFKGEKIFKMIKDRNTDYPLMVMELWSGWFDHWGNKFRKVPTLNEFSKLLEFVLKKKASLNFYMFHGGTNFGFMAGANHFEVYKPDVTSYDYDAPVSEAGDITPKYLKIRDMIREMVLVPRGDSLYSIPPNLPKIAYGTVKIQSYLPLKDILSIVSITIKNIPLKSKTVMPMENLDINNKAGQSYGYILYQTTLKMGRALKIEGHVRDRAHILVDSLIVRTVDSATTDQLVVLPLTRAGQKLEILVENQGRVNFVIYPGTLLNDQRKGLSSGITLDGQPVENWDIYPLEFKTSFLISATSYMKWSMYSPQILMPALYKAVLDIQGEPKDTFLYMKGWKKGIVFINKFNLGRYWDVGPQVSLYVPAPILKEGANQILIFEELQSQGEINFYDKPNLGQFSLPVEA